MPEGTPECIWLAKPDATANFKKLQQSKIGDSTNIVSYNKKRRKNGTTITLN